MLVQQCIFVYHHPHHYPLDAPIASCHHQNSTNPGLSTPTVSTSQKPHLHSCDNRPTLTQPIRASSRIFRWIYIHGFACPYTHYSRLILRHLTISVLPMFRVSSRLTSSISFQSISTYHCPPSPPHHPLHSISHSALTAPFHRLSGLSMVGRLRARARPSGVLCI